ncbi:Mphase phosphoprotein 6, putative [Acanthamoeba castellanii str. Neff]|uniref:Mphase phosphoprotein 6, putative n=1 Tax=Acanthamoeba castellanii (strain ATCC 30010 / Neff) TaxID=1257118 RepID=L8GRV2_ACACF|nr:Mphase phosphoprotein 6, putative [Acanthamoeba castellanii str. Neff]ELR15914.1 Mphase phosphoprotein 6, putative [Acanthamoeba castellanii str. Neff]
MTTPSPNKKLSNNLMGMKFMQRKQQADLIAQQLKEEASQREAAHWVVSNPQAAIIPPTAVVADEQVVTGVRSGRMSFGQFNPSIEELHHGPKETKIEEKDTLEWSAVYRNQAKAKQEEMGRKSMYGRNRKRTGNADSDDEKKGAQQPDAKRAKKDKTPKKEKKTKKERKN